MSTILRLGPADHGRPMTFDEFVAGDYESGSFHPTQIGLDQAMWPLH